jgi:hypothetical protein
LACPAVSRSCCTSLATRRQFRLSCN